MSRIRCWQVDAFTNRRFGGNPAAVCWLEEPAETAWMQSVAAEMNLSETAFVRQLDQDYELRWFTPACEVDLCGHATLATAHALWWAGVVTDAGPLRFQTRSGLLTCQRNGEFIELDFPATPPEPVDVPSGLAEAMGVRPVFVGRSRFDYLVAVATETEVREARPDYPVLGRFPVRGVILTAPSDDPAFDFVSRFFAPAVGIDEDPVCGSAHCALAPYWGERFGKRELMARQVSVREGLLRLRWIDDRVILGGQAVTVCQGELV